MVIIYVILAIFLLLIVLLFTVRSKIDVVFITCDSDMHITLLWLYPLLKSVVTRVNGRLSVSIYLLNKKVLTRQIYKKQSPSVSANIIRHLNPTDICVDTQYGFRDPFFTGLACSAVTMASEYFNVKSLNQKPDFLAASDYIDVDATARLNLGKSILKLI